MKYLFLFLLSPLLAIAEDPTTPGPEAIELAYKLNQNGEITLKLERDTKTKRVLGDLKVSFQNCEAKVRFQDPRRAPRERDYVKCVVKVKTKELEFDGIALTVGSLTSFDVTVALEKKEEYSLDLTVTGIWYQNTGKWEGEGVIDGWFKYSKGRLATKLTCKDKFTFG